MSAPLMPAPTTTPADVSRVSGPCATVRTGRPCHTDCPVRRSREGVTPTWPP